MEPTFSDYPTDETALRILPEHLRDAFWKGVRRVWIDVGQGLGRKCYAIDECNPWKRPIPDWLKDALRSGGSRLVVCITLRLGHRREAEYETQLHPLALALILALAKRAWEPGMGITAPADTALFIGRDARSSCVVKNIGPARPDPGQGHTLHLGDVVHADAVAPSQPSKTRRLFWDQVPREWLAEPGEVRLLVWATPTWRKWVHPTRARVEEVLAAPRPQQIFIRGVWHSASRATVEVNLFADGAGDAPEILRLLARLYEEHADEKGRETGR